MRVLDLFCGAGGFSEGFRSAGCEVVAGVDHDPDACATFALNFPEATTICGDITVRRVRASVVEAAGHVDVIVGGPPCQAFSQVRNHDRTIKDARNQLYKQFLSFVDELEPRAFVMENVPGLLQLNAQRRIAADLARKGRYSVSVHEVDAVDFGVPQTRKRVVFVGIHESERSAAFELEGTGAAASLSLKRGDGEYLPQVNEGRGQDLFRRLLSDEDPAVVTVRQAISDLRGRPAGVRDDTLPVTELPAPESAYQRAMRVGLGRVLHNVSVPRINADTVLRLSGIPPGGNHTDLTAQLKERYLTGQRWGQHNGSGKLARRHYYAYRRLHPDFWAWTLNTKADAAYHWDAERALAVREFARLQSFPDRFVFVTDPRKGDLPGRIAGGAAHSRYRQVGNAVPPLLARALANSLAHVLHGSHAAGVAQVAV